MQPKEKGPHFCDPFVLLVGRARFELATNGLKDLRIVLNSNQNINLNLPRKSCDIGNGFCGVDWADFGLGWFRQRLIGVSCFRTLVLSV